MSTRVLLIVLLSAPAVSFGGQVQARSYAGRAVADVLRELQATHLKIIFSSERVPPALRVLREPRGSDPRDIALQILEPHGLTLQQGPGGTFIVVARPPRREETRKPPPRQQEPAEPPAAPDDAGSVRIAEHVEVIERTTESGVSPRVHAVEPVEVREMAGGLENVLQSLQGQPGVAGTNDEDGKLAVRGGGPEHNLIVLDGVQIHNAQRFGEFTTSFLNPATAASITLDPSGLDARFGGRLSSVINLETRDGTIARALAVSGSVGLTSGDLLLEGRMPGTSSGSWWATARGTYYRFVADRFTDGAMPSFADLQFKATLYPTRRTRRRRPLPTKASRGSSTSISRETTRRAFETRAPGRSSSARNSRLVPVLECAWKAISGRWTGSSCSGQRPKPSVRTGCAATPFPTTSRRIPRCSSTGQRSFRSA